VSEVFALVLTASTVSIALFCMTALLLRSRKTPAYSPLALFFITLCFACGGPLVNAMAPQALSVFYQFTFPAYLAMGPLLWFYVKGLTSESRWHYSRNNALHLAPFLFGMALVLFDVFIFDVGQIKKDPEAYWAGIGALEKTYTSIVLTLWGFAWMILRVQPFVYLFLIVKRLSKYRSRLKDVYASIEDRDLGWLNYYLVIFAGVWTIVLVTIINENISGAKTISPLANAALFLLLVVALGLFGLYQKPGFEDQYLNNSKNQISRTANDSGGESGKYQRSALNTDDAIRISGKIRAAMEDDKLYLDPSLSLKKLSDHLRISPNYISQTLNETIGECFFDYVNKWRIEAAKPDIIRAEKTILAVAYGVGFNARSSFYKAFKRETGQTPSEYRNGAKLSDTVTPLTKQV